MNNHTITRDGAMQSPWQSGLKPEPLTYAHDVSTVFDALVIGGGITGITAALMIQEAGKSCIIAEAHSIGFGTTSGTSAHINTFADTTYSEAKSGFGAEGAQLFADAVNEGFAIIKNNIAAYHINCDYEEKKAYVYAEDDDQAKELDDLYEGAKEVGVPIEYVDTVPTPLKYVKAAVLDGQAQFHPIKYLKVLQQEFLKAGGVILEDTLIDNVATEDGMHIAKSGGVTIKAKKVIYATHQVPGINVFSFRCAPYRSYVLGVTLKDGAYPNALIYDLQDPYHYVRTHVIDGQQYLLIGGNDHKTGHDDEESAFADLEKYTRKSYAVDAVTYKWSSQYYIPVDGFPYIGQIPGFADGIYCATGFNSNGMMLGSISAKILSDMVMDNESKYADVFKPSRLKPITAFTDFVKENADVAYHFIADRFSSDKIESLKQIKKGTGEIVEFDGKKIAAYRDTEGTVHALNPVCTHAKCIVNWNQAERSWDCPCHGARFDVDGVVLTGPAIIDLEKINVD